MVCNDLVIIFIKGIAAFKIRKTNLGYVQSNS